MLLEPRCEKTCLHGFRQSEIQTILLSYRDGCAGWSAPLLFPNHRRQVFSRRCPFTIEHLFFTSSSQLSVHSYVVRFLIVFPCNEQCVVIKNKILEPVHEISNNVVCATSKASDQPAQMRSLTSAFASHLSILWLLSNWLNTIWSF